MSILATVVTTRPDAAKFWLFVHVLGAMTTVGALTLCLVSLAGAWRSGSETLTRLGFRALVWVAIPAFFVMRIAAQIVLNKEGLDNDDIDLTWVNIGFSVTDMGFILLIIAAILGRLATRRSASEGGSAWTRITVGLVSVLLIAYLVAVWAMTTKPV
jgi:hypothetical protein